MGIVMPSMSVTALSAVAGAGADGATKAEAVPKWGL